MALRDLAERAQALHVGRERDGEHRRVRASDDGVDRRARAALRAAGFRRSPGCWCGSGTLEGFSVLSREVCERVLRLQQRSEYLARVLCRLGPAELLCSALAAADAG